VGKKLLPVYTIFLIPFLVISVYSIKAESPCSKKTDQLHRLRPFQSHGHVYNEDNIEAMRPRIMGIHGVVSTGHYLATQAGIETLKKGGNAFDAGVTAAMALKVTKMGYAGWNGVAPLILYSAQEKKVMTRIGAGTSPAKATLDYFIKHGKNPINSALIPADVDVWLAVLNRYGTFSFKEAAQPALDIAQNGYHLYKMQKYLLEDRRDSILKFPYNTQFWFQHGVDKQQIGDLMINRDLGKLILLMIDAEKVTLSKGKSRSEGIQAARDTYYRGEPARAIDSFFEENNGILTYEDMANYEGKWMPPLHTSYKDFDVYTCDGWSQGPRMILFLNMLENFDVKTLGYNTAEYIHLVSQVINLAMSDCHKYIGDPDIVDIPKNLYSKAYAKKRITLIDMDKAFQDMPPWGDPQNMKSISPDSPKSFTQKDPSRLKDEIKIEDKSDLDTTSLNVMDAEGNLFSMTESDGHMSTPMIPEWGFGLGDRMVQFNLDPKLANVMAPRKRPRNTNTPIIIMKGGKPFLGLSTPGGDQQAQALLQVLLNIVEWGMSPQQALDQPRFGSYNFPATGSEFNTHPAQLNLEDRIPKETEEALLGMGHDIRSWGLWNYRACAPTITYRDPNTGVLIAAADVRREAYALGY
jgi:gamma-glutamyltranspeptidase/glutathione hydrolase